jgi:hypothetical protein
MAALTSIPAPLAESSFYPPISGDMISSARKIFAAKTIFRRASRGADRVWMLGVPPL